MASVTCGHPFFERFRLAAAEGPRTGLYSTEFGLVLFALANIVVFSSLVWWNALVLNKAASERDQATKQKTANLP